MSALEMGAKRAGAYLQRYSVEALAKMTLQEFCSIGRLDGRQHYKRQKAIDEYALGWWNTGKSFLTLFKPDDSEQFVAEKEIERIDSLLRQAEEKIRKLMEWRKDNYTISTSLGRAVDDLEEVQCDIQDVANYLKRPQEA